MSFNTVKKTIQIACMASLLGAGIAQANPCDGFKITIKNNLTDPLTVLSMDIPGADFQPKGWETISAKSEATFTVNNVKTNAPLEGTINLSAVKLPPQPVSLKFTLEDRKAFCEHTAKAVDNKDITVNVNRTIGGVNYSIE